jgi:hypothetical protein
VGSSLPAGGRICSLRKHLEPSPLGTLCARVVRMLRTIHAFTLRGLAGAAIAFALFLWILPLSLYAEGIWLQELVDLICFLVVSALLSSPLGIAASSSWRRSAELLGNQRKKPQPCG